MWPFQKKLNKNPRLNLANLEQFFSQKSFYYGLHWFFFSAWQVAKN
jgi:hypothetical protein